MITWLRFGRNYSIKLCSMFKWHAIQRQYKIISFSLSWWFVFFFLTVCWTYECLEWSLHFWTIWNVYLVNRKRNPFVNRVQNINKVKAIRNAHLVRAFKFKKKRIFFLVFSRNQFSLALQFVIKILVQMTTTSDYQLRSTSSFIARKTFI